MAKQDKNIKNFPNLRFPGFDGDWTSSRLGDFAKFSKGKGISKIDIDENGETECIRYGELYTHYGEVIDEIKSKTSIDKSSLVLSEENDVIIPASGETQIDIATASCVLKSDVALGGDLNIIKTLNNGAFLSYYLNSKKKINIARLSQGISVVHLYSSQLALLSLNLPSLAEQHKIAMFLTLISDRISKSMKIIENLKLQKNIILKKIFEEKADKNEDVIQKKLDAFLSIPPKIKPDYIDKEKLLTVKLHLKGVHKNENSETLSIGSTNYFIRRKGQFIYGKQNLFNGAFALIPEHYDGFLSSADVPSLEINNKIINAKYLLYLFSRKSFYKKLEDISSGSGSKRIHETTLLKIKILVPTLERQNKIVDILTSLDNKINLENDLLTQYGLQKKHLLANLFI